MDSLDGPCPRPNRGRVTSAAVSLVLEHRLCWLPIDHPLQSRAGSPREPSFPILSAAHSHPAAGGRPGLLRAPSGTRLHPHPLPHHERRVFPKLQHADARPEPLAAYVSAVTRVPFARNSETRMSRDCLYVDLDLHLPHAEERSALFRLRIANTHLESLRGFGDAARPKQLAKIAKLLTAPGIDGGVVAGDMNCIAPTDQDLPEEVGLADAWVKKEGHESNAEGDDTGEADGHTWGYQPKNRFPPRRMDKVLFAGNVSATIVQRVGVGLRVERDKNPVWVSDHYGLLASLAFSRPAIES
ncbi:unnamed protein product [Mycena citricolor]|uniref:Endonuclease/exonuclease/phosphatase domain-containing protein n=1 Tax=Mycena citricolor TaxID=2018698 RepID=A0AAD2GWI8_9AGAR|nr:unnamed protein product [Mycena citricolor]